MHAKFTKHLLSMFIFILFLTGCASSAPGTQGTSTGQDTLRVTTTIGMITDLVSNIGREHVEVTGLMGPGIDPHLYKASEGDIAKLGNADVIFYGGLHLEGRMGDLFVKMARSKPTVAVSERISEDLLLEIADGQLDPHIWFDVSLWLEAAEVVRDTLIELDPDHRSDYETYAEEYMNELEDLDAYVRKRMNEIPETQRVLVTAHDAFGYFGRAYDMEVVGLQGISTAAEYGLADVRNLVDLLVSRKIQAVFLETSIAPRSIESVVAGAQEKGHQVVIGGELFSDSMGDAGTPEGTYIGMVRHNVDTIVEALSPKDDSK